MKIVDKKIWWEFTCKSCGSTCQADPADVTSLPNKDCDGDTVGHILVVKCGVCGKAHSVPSSKVTERIEGIAARKRKRR